MMMKTSCDGLVMSLLLAVMWSTCVRASGSYQDFYRNEEGELHMVPDDESANEEINILNDAIKVVAKLYAVRHDQNMGPLDGIYGMYNDTIKDLLRQLADGLANREECGPIKPNVVKYFSSLPQMNDSIGLLQVVLPLQVKADIRSLAHMDPSEVTNRLIQFIPYMLRKTEDPPPTHLRHNTNGDNIGAARVHQNEPCFIFHVFEHMSSSIEAMDVALLQHLEPEVDPEDRWRRHEGLTSRRNRG